MFLKKLAANICVVTIKVNENNVPDEKILLCIFPNFFVRMYGTLFCSYHNYKTPFLLLLLVGNYFMAMYTCIWCANVQNRLDKYINNYSRRG